MKYTAVIFDLDDTLCNTSDILKDLYEDFHGAIQADFPRHTIKDIDTAHKNAYEELVHQSDLPIHTAYVTIWYRIYELLGEKPSLHKIHRYYHLILDMLLKKLEPTAGAVELLKRLHSASIRVGILTNGPFYQQTHKTHTLKIESYIEYMVTPDMCLADKPDKKAYEYIFDKMNVIPSKTLMVGDNFEADIVGGHRVGMDTAYVDVGRNDQTDDVTPTYTVKNLTQLHKHLFK